jgi:hypothetical protein
MSRVAARSASLAALLAPPA